MLHIDPKPRYDLSLLKRQIHNRLFRPGKDLGGDLPIIPAQNPDRRTRISSTVAKVESPIGSGDYNRIIEQIEPRPFRIRLQIRGSAALPVCDEQGMRLPGITADQADG
jgi:hypothetical protein